MDWQPKWCWELTFGTRRRIWQHCTCRQDMSLGETMKWLHPLHFKWWTLPSLPSTVHFLGFCRVMQCKRHQKDFYWEKMHASRGWNPRQSPPIWLSSPSLGCTHTFDCDSQVTALPATSHKSFGRKVLSKALLLSLGESKQREVWRWQPPCNFHFWHWELNTE